MEAVQVQFDSTKATLLTAGLLVARGLATPTIQTRKLWGHSGLRVVLACTILSAIFLVLSFVIAEHQAKRHDKLTGQNPKKRWETGIYVRIQSKNSKG